MINIRNSIYDANMGDITAMIELMEPEVEKGVLLRSSSEDIAKRIQYFILLKEKNQLFGMCALYIYDHILCEIRSLVIKENYRGRGYGKLLIIETLKKASLFKLKEVLVLTYQKELFLKLGFRVIEKSFIPNPKIWMDCINCKKFLTCDEIALIKKL